MWWEPLKTAAASRSMQNRLRSGCIRKGVERRTVTSNRPHAAIPVIIHAARKMRARKMRKTKTYGLQSGRNSIRNFLAKHW
jgi:hypothetical protein